MNWARNRSEIDQGRYAGYVLRKQRAQAVPLFLILTDGKLQVKREARLKEVVATFRVSSHAQVEVIDGYAGPAFLLDKEVLFVANEAVRSNWIVALRTAMLAAEASKETLEPPIEIESPVTATIRSRLLGRPDGACAPHGGRDHHRPQRALICCVQALAHSRCGRRCRRTKPADAGRRRRLARGLLQDLCRIHPRGRQRARVIRVRSQMAVVGQRATTADRQARGRRLLGGIDRDPSPSDKAKLASMVDFGTLASNNFGTFRVDESIDSDDEQEKFANLRLDFDVRPSRA